MNRDERPQRLETVRVLRGTRTTMNPLPIASAASELSAEFTTAYRTQRAFLLKVVRQLGVPPADIEDAVQDVFMVLHLRIHQLERSAGLRLWLRAVAVRICSNRRRSIARRSARCNSDVDLTTNEVADSHQRTPHEFSVASEQRRLLTSVINRLDASQREVFILAEIEQRTVDEISAMTRVCRNTVASRLRVARERVVYTLRRVQGPGALSGSALRSGRKVSRRAR